MGSTQGSGLNKMWPSLAKVRKGWLRWKRGVRRFARSPWMSAAAAVAVVLGTAGTYVSGDIATDTQSCTLRRELLIASGSPDLEQLRAALLRISEARTYLTLALAPQNPEQRREYAFLGITAANNAVLALPEGASARIGLLHFPTDRQLTSLPYMASLANKVNHLDVAQLVQTLRVHDQEVRQQLNELG